MVIVQEEKEEEIWSTVSDSWQIDIDAAETVMVIVQEEKEEEIWSTVSDSWQILQG